MSYRSNCSCSSLQLGTVATECGVEHKFPVTSYSMGELWMKYATKNIQHCLQFAAYVSVLTVRVKVNGLALDRDGHPLNTLRVS